MTASTAPAGANPRGSPSSRLAAAAVFAVYLAAGLAGQWWAGCYQAEFGDHPDEPSHYITGLMVRDYLVSGLSKLPMEFAEDYYLHYPKVAIGYWPPFFYAIQGVWGVVFSGDRWAVMLLMAFLTALIAWSFYLAGRRLFGPWLAACGGLVLLGMPTVFHHGQRVMAENLIALLIFLATIAYGRYLDSEGWRASALFGLIALAAVLTKGTGIVLALAPPLAILISRRWRLLLSPVFWLPAVIVLVGAAPWYLLAPGADNERTVRVGGMGNAPANRWVAAYAVYRLLGPVLAGLAAIGLAERVARLVRRQPVEGVWIAALAVVGAFLLIPSVIPVIAADPRYFIGFAVVLTLTALQGTAVLVSRAPPWSRVPLAAGLFLAVAASFAGSHRAKMTFGYGEVAEQLLARDDLRRSVFLVASDSRGEGVFTAEVAMRERRPGHVVLRASKALASQSWSGYRVRLITKTPEEAMKRLESVPVEVLVLDNRPRGPYAFEDLLRDMLKQYPDRWERIYTASPRHARTAGRTIEVFRQKGVAGKWNGEIPAEIQDRLRPHGRRD